MENYESKHFAGKGAVYVAPRDANNQPAGYGFIGNASTVNMTANVDIKKKLDHVSGNNGTAASWISNVSYALTLSLDSIKPEHLATSLHGVVTAKAAGSVTDEAATGYADKFISLEHTNVSAVVVTGSAGTPTYVEDTDYIVHADAGLIEIVDGGGIADATDLLNDYGYGDQHHIKIDPNNNEIFMMFAGINNADNNKQTRCEMYKVKLTPGALNMISDDGEPIQITGELIQDLTRPAGDQFYSWKTQD